jgi:hypothetical protein
MSSVAGRAEERNVVQAGNQNQRNVTARASAATPAANRTPESPATSGRMLTTVDQ